jgi:hypothetical protein
MRFGRTSFDGSIGLRAAGMKVREASIGAAQIKRRRSRPMLALALLLAAALLGDPASAQDKTAGTDADRQDASQSVIRLGMSADFSASARALSIELYRGAMAYLLPLNNAGGVNGRRVVIKAYVRHGVALLCGFDTPNLTARGRAAPFSVIQIDQGQLHATSRLAEIGTGLGRWRARLGSSRRRRRRQRTGDDGR